MLTEHFVCDFYKIFSLKQSKAVKKFIFKFFTIKILLKSCGNFWKLNFYISSLKLCL